MIAVGAQLVSFWMSSIYMVLSGELSSSTRFVYAIFSFDVIFHRFELTVKQIRISIYTLYRSSGSGLHMCGKVRVVSHHLSTLAVVRLIRFCFLWKRYQLPTLYPSDKMGYMRENEQFFLKINQYSDITVSSPWIIQISPANILPFLYWRFCTLNWHLYI